MAWRRMEPAFARWPLATVLLTLLLVQIAVATAVAFVPMPWYGRWVMIVAGIWVAVLMAPRLTGRGLPRT
jgi:hypothetical protein